jgi:hypothetical protein
MAEVADLSRKPDAEPLRPGQVSLFLRQHGAEKPCAACGSTKHTMWPESSAEEGAARGMVLLACDRCQAVRQHLRAPIVAWVRGARHA